MKDFIDEVLKRDSLVVKEFNGAPVTGRELFEYFKVIKMSLSNIIICIYNAPIWLVTIH